MKLIILNILLFVSIDVYGQYSETCAPLDGVERKCMRYQDCPKAIRDLVARGVFRQLRESRCGDMKQKKLCCQQPECYTWDGRAGQCVKYNADTATLFPEDATFRQLKFSVCKKHGVVYNEDICYSDLPINNTGDCELDKSAFPPDPAFHFGCCGQERSASSIIGGSNAQIDQFPWLAVLKYQGDRKSCTGALISGKYVLTAAHCVTSDKPYAVVLGEYDKRTEIDCADDDCNEEPITAQIEEIIVHENFVVNSEQRRDDIALIRLKDMVNYSDFILPVCLPIDYKDATDMPDAVFKLVSAGWGSDGNNQPSYVKRVVKLPFVNRTDCLTHYPLLGRKQLCAGGDRYMDSCIGDDGAPLVNDRLGTYEILGITNHGNTMCGRDGVPTVYTKVFSYVNWIHSNIRP